MDVYWPLDPTDEGTTDPLKKWIYVGTQVIENFNLQQHHYDNLKTQTMKTICSAVHVYKVTIKF